MKLLASIAAGVASLGLSLPAVAGSNSMEEHRRLWDSVEQAGVTVVLNSPVVCDSKTSGQYNSGEGLLFVCQENATVPYKDIGWTDYDLDTLRHEAHHVVQDCVAGGLGDWEFQPLFRDEDELLEFITSSLTEDEIRWVIDTYTVAGLPEDVIAQELEAFAAAKVVSAETIANVVTEVCK